MKYSSLEIDGRSTYGVVLGDGVIDLGKRFGHEYADLKALVAAGFPQHVAAAASGPADYALDRIRFLPPIAAPAPAETVAATASPPAATDA